MKATRGPLALIVVAMLSCGSDDNVTRDQAPTVKSVQDSLSSALDPKAVFLVPVVSPPRWEWPHDNEPYYEPRKTSNDPKLIEAAWTDAPDGGAFALIRGSSPFVSPKVLLEAGSSPFLHVSGDGRITILRSAELLGQLSMGRLKSSTDSDVFRIIELGDSAIVDSEVLGVWWLRANPPRLQSWLQTLGRDNAIGRGLAPNSYVFVSRTAEAASASVNTLDPSTGKTLSSKKVAIPAGWHAGDPDSYLYLPKDLFHIQWTAELADGVVAWVEARMESAGLRYLYCRSDSPDELALSMEPIRNGAFRLDSDGSLLVIASDGNVYRWNVSSGGTRELVASPPATPYGPWLDWQGFGNASSAKYEPGFDDVPEPKNFAALSLQQGAFSVRELETTPCSSRDACRAVGESYLLGTMGAPAHAVSLYLHWAWIERTNDSSPPNDFGAIVARAADPNQALSVDGMGSNPGTGGAAGAGGAPGTGGTAGMGGSAGMGGAIDAGPDGSEDASDADGSTGDGGAKGCVDGLSNPNECGPVDMAAYCKNCCNATVTFDPLSDPPAWGWSCEGKTMSLNDACAQQYGSATSGAACDDLSDANCWYCAKAGDN